MVVGESAYAILLHATVAMVIMAASSTAILTTSKMCSEHSCKCDSQRIDCNCHGNFQELIFNEPPSLGVNDITINNCSRVTISKSTIKNLRNIVHLNINNVRDLKLEESSLNWCDAIDCKKRYSIYDLPGPTITIRNTIISEIQSHTFKGRIGEIDFRNVTIKKLQPFAFTSIYKMRNLKITDSIVDVLQAQAFKRFETENLLITNTRIPILPSRSFSEVDVTGSFKIHNSHFGSVKPLAFFILYPKSSEISSSQFEEFEGDSFKIIADGGVTIRDNCFKNMHSGAFGGISSMKERSLTLPDLVFTNNTINALTKDTLKYNQTSFTAKFNEINLNLTCTCANIQIWTKDTQWIGDVHCVVTQGRIKTWTKALNFKASNCDVASKSWIVIIAVIVSILVLLVIASIVLFFVYRKYKQRKQKEFVSRGRNRNGSLRLIVPDGRTYRETELHVIVEKAELLTTEL